MVCSTIKNVRLKGLSLILGENKKNLAENPFYYNNDLKKLKSLQNTVGIDTRYITNPDTTSSDLALEAAEKLLAELKINAETIDAVIFITQTPDYKYPGNAYVIHKKLTGGLKKDTMAMDITQGCSGFIWGFYQSAIMINSGLKRILLLCADTLSKMVHPKDKATIPILGDSASAAIIEYDENSPETYFILKSQGEKLENIYCPAGGFRMPASKETKKEIKDVDGNIRTLENFYMNGFEVFTFTFYEQPLLFNEIMKYSNLKKEDIDYFIFHQANGYIVKNIINNIKIPPEKSPSKAFSMFGNLNSSSVPSAICGELRDKLEGKKKILIQGFGTGLSWGAAITEVDNLICLKPQSYKGGKNE